MVHIAPFRALRYQGQDMAKVTSPPHDVITDEERDAFLESDPHNIVAVTLPPGGDEKYQAAAKALAMWQESGVLTREARPAFYRYEVQHPAGTMTGFFCKVAVDPAYESIRRHEMTLPKKRSTRLHLLEACNANPESIWLLYRDERGWVDEVLSSNAFDCLYDFTDEEGLKHKLWRVDRPEAVAEVQAQFEDRTVVIADGHHRYATQVKHYQATGRDEDGSLLVCMVRDNDPGLAIRPTNRLLVDLPFANLEAAVSDLPDWRIDRLDLPGGDDAAHAAFLRGHVEDPRTVVAYSQDGAWKMRFEGSLDQGRGRVDRLAVTVLHDHLLTKHWGVNMDEVEEHLRYSRSDEETVALVHGGTFPCAVFLAPEPVDAVLDVASEGHLMPQKATYFVPKLRSGLVLAPCDEPRPQAMDAGLEPGKPNFQMPPLD
ncbi:MAG: DUF1015 family protein [Thermoplasmatota archaeon]